ncbi:unnamed protein product [Victoria cruziana]
MGISLLVGAKAIVLLVVFRGLRRIIPTIFSMPFLHASLASFLISIASHPYLNLPLILGKNPNGSFPLWSYILFGPYLIFIRIYVYFRRLKRREPLYNEIIDGIYVGGWPSPLDSAPPGDLAIVDCTCELPKSSLFSKNEYICIPTWDTRAPQPSEIELAVRWACRKRAQSKPVYIHCAFGHGRSVSVLCALLVALGVSDHWKEAEKIVKKQRSSIRMNALHRKSLEEWTKCRNSYERKDDQSISSIITPEASRK